MPVYLLHGFRWPRAGLTGVRVWSVMHNLDDCSAEYIQNEGSTGDILASFRVEFPDIMRTLEGPGKGLTFVEQYDPEDEGSENAVSQPYVFVGDRVITIADNPKAGEDLAIQRSGETSSKAASKLAQRARGPPGTAPTTTAASLGSALSLNFDEATKSVSVLSSKEWEALADLRDKIAGENEKIGWWIVYNGDPDRSYDEIDDDDDSGSGALTPTATALPTGKEIAVDHQHPLSQKPLPQPAISNTIRRPSDLPQRSKVGTESDNRAATSTRTTANTERDRSEESRPKTPSRTDAVKKFFGKK